MRRLDEYWRTIHPRNGGLPGRQHFFDPTAMPELLTHLWLVDVRRNPLRFEVRLAGSEAVVVIEHD